jgi:hypothetical protein
MKVKAKFFVGNKKNRPKKKEGREGDAESKWAGSKKPLHLRVKR